MSSTAPPIDLRPAWAFAERRWGVLTTGDALYRHLKADDGWTWILDADWTDETDGRGTATLPGVVRWWKASYVDRCPPAARKEALRRWKLLGQMLWSFELARTRPAVASELMSAVASLPDFIDGGITGLPQGTAARSDEAARAYMWARSIGGVEPLRAVHVPVALYDRISDTGFLATLEAELMPDGVGAVAAHPSAAFETVYHQTFDESMRHAWKMALKTVPHNPLVDGRWRLRRGSPTQPSPSQPLPIDAVDGPSASGAAARAWWHLLHARTPDPEVVVLAQIARGGDSFEPVDRITEKIQAVVREVGRQDGSRSFDTIVVAERTQERTAREALGHELSGLTLVGLDRGPALETLASIRSRQAAEMLALLADYSTALNVTPWIWPHSGASILVSEVFVDLDVLEQTSERELMAVQPAVRTVDEIDAARYELPTSIQDSDRVPWSRLQRSADRRVLTGPPGSGKSFLSRYTAVDRLRQAHRELGERRVPGVNLPVTVWVTASALAAVDHRSSLTTTVVTAAANSLDMDAGRRERFKRWIDNGLMNRNALIIVDGLDEVQPENLEACRRRLAQIAGLPGQMLLTCRTLHWEFLKGELVPSLAAEQFELAPLVSKQLRQLVHRLFAEESDRGAHVHLVLQQNPGLRHACTTPLRLLFVCLLARDGRVNSTTTYAGLYTHLLRALVEGRWRTDRPRWVSRPLQVEQVIETLIGIGWELFLAAPANNRFTLTAWTTAASRASGRRAPSVRMLDDLVALGLVVPAGFSRMGDRCWSFAHRTILEYLAARNLAARPTEEWLATATTHIWFEPEWSEVLTFLASAVPDASPLLRVVDREADDIFGSMVELRARLAGVASHVSANRARRIACEVLGLALSDSGFVPGRVERSLRALGWSRLGPLLVELRRNPGERSRRVVVDAIGQLGPGEPVIHLLDALRNDINESVRAAAARALGKTGSSESIPIVVQAMRDDPSARVRGVCADALVHLGDESALAVLSTAFHNDPDRSVRSAAAEAILALAGPEHVDYVLDALTVDTRLTSQRVATRLGELGAMGAVEPLSRVLLTQEHVHEGDSVRDEFNAAIGARRAAVRALGSLGGRDAAGILRQVMLDHESPPVRRAASSALRKLIGDDAFSALVAPLVSTICGDIDPVRRQGAAAAAAGYTGAFAALTRALETDPDEDVRKEAVYGLAPFFEVPESESPLRPLTQALRGDPHPDVRSAAVSALWKNRSAVPALVDALRGDPNARVRYHAAGALASSGDPGGLPALLAAAENDPDSFVRDGAAKAIVDHVAPGLLEPLIETLLASPASTAAAYALGRRGVPRSVHPIRDGTVASLAWSGKAAIALNRLGLECRDTDRLGLARTLVHAAMSWDRRTRGRRHQKVAHRLLNLAGVELMRSGPDRARRLLVRAWASCARSADLTTARVLTMRLIVASIEGESHSTYLGQLKTILDEGALSNVADVDQERFAAPVLTFVEPYLTSEDRLLVAAIMGVLKGTSPASTLSELDIFARQPPLPLDQRWETPDRATIRG